MGWHSWEFLLRLVPFVHVLFLCAPFRCATATRASVRGVAPSRLAEYKGHSVFHCPNDRKEIDVSRVNDDVCDCVDGSDEPGTSACANGVFHCQNVGFRPRDLPATFVDDGVCDCCDGSDEKRGCNDSCAALGKLARAEAETKLDQYQKGASARQSMIHTAARKMSAWKERAEELEYSVSLLTPVVASLKGQSPAL